MRPTVDFRRSSYKLQSSVSAADKLREHRTGAEYVSDNLVCEKEDVEGLSNENITEQTVCRSR